jgi:hypothetical protein
MPGLVPGIHVFAAGQGVDGRDKRGHGSSPRREMMRRIWQSWALTLALLVAGAVGQPSRADDSGRLLRLDHYVGVRSTVPAISGQMTEIYVREVVSARSLRDGVAANRVVLFVHGAGTPRSPSMFHTAITAGWNISRGPASTFRHGQCRLRTLDPPLAHE